MDYNNTSDQPKSAMQSALEHQAEALHELEEEIAKLETALAPISVDLPQPSETGGSEAEKIVESVIVADLRRYTTRINLSAYNLRVIRQKLEV